MIDPIRDDLSKIRETLAVQNQVLSTIVQRQEQSAQIAAQHSAQLSVVVTDVAILKSDMPKFQTEINSLNAWKTDALNVFVPRREHEALHHEERIAELEQWRHDDGQDEVQHQRTLLQWMADHAVALVLFVVTTSLSLYAIFR